MRINTTSISLPTLLVAVTIPCWAHDATEILHVGDLDRDGIADTVVGRATGDLRMLASAIRWGSPYSSGASESETTTLVYPEWRGLEGSLAIEDLDGDGADDLVLFYSASRRTRDSARSIALLAHPGLRGTPSIVLDELPRGLQRRPFLALDLAAADVLVDGATREHSGVPSWRWERVALRARDTTPTAIPSTLAEWVSLYPNPASAAATIASARLAAGSYTVDLVDMEGTVHLERALVLESDQAIEGTIDLSDQAPGLYLVRIRRGAELVASYPVVVVR